MNVQSLLYRLLRVQGDVRAARRGPGAYGHRVARRQAHGELARLLRRVLRP